MREKLKRTRARKSKLRLVKNGKKLIEDFAQLESDLRNELDHGDVDSISFLFGATVHSAREVYMGNVPNNLRSEPGQPQSRQRNSIESPNALLVKFHPSVNLQISLQMFILLKSNDR